MNKNLRPGLPAKAQRRALLGTGAVLLSLLLTACDGDVSDLERYMADVKDRPSRAIEPIPEMRSFETFTYTESGLRNPFDAPLSQPSARTVRRDGPRPDQARPREALEDFALDSLRMMGTLSQQGQLWGLVRDPGGTIHRVQVGNYIGRNHGRIVDISGRAIELRELVPDGRDGYVHREAALAVRD